MTKMCLSQYFNVLSVFVKIRIKHKQKIKQFFFLINIKT